MRELSYQELERDEKNIKRKLQKIIFRELFDRVNILGDGQSFGELALTMKHCKRNATIRTLTDCHLAVLTEQDYDKVYGKIEKQEQNNFIAYCRQMPFFKHASTLFLT